MRNKNLPSQAGFTLIESLLYIALFSIIIGGALVAVYQMIESSDAVSAKNIVEMEGSFLLRKIDWALTGAFQVDTISPHHLFIEKKEIDYCSATTTYEFYLNSTNLILRKGCTAPTSFAGYPLSGTSVKIEGLDFLKFTALEKPDGIHASTTIASFD